MSDLKKIFQKQGGMKLIKQYFESGSLFTAVGEFVLLGKSRTSLEILRLSTQLKAKQKLEKKYKVKLNEFKEHYVNLPHQTSNKIFICWFQGIENAPVLVKKCYESVKTNLKDYEIVLITSDNIRDYVDFPDYILEKWEQGIITHTHMTDLLRLELLIKYGGLWLDSTVLCTSPQEEIPDYFFNSDLFFFQSLKPGRDGHTHVNSSWLMSAKSNNEYLMACRYLCYEYWKENNKMMDYFLLHDFMAMCLEAYPDVWLNIPPRDNATPHILYLRLFEKYNEDTWNMIKAQTPFHKLSYKFDATLTQKEDTYYKKVLKL